MKIIVSNEKKKKIEKTINIIKTVYHLGFLCDKEIFKNVVDEFDHFHTKSGLIINISYGDLFGNTIKLRSDTWEKDVCIEISNNYGDIKAWYHHGFNWRFEPSFVNINGFVPDIAYMWVEQFLDYLYNYNIDNLQINIKHKQRKLGEKSFGLGGNK